MSGKPVLHRTVAELRRRTAERFPDEPTANELDYVADWVASGRTMTALAKELGVSYSLVLGYLRKHAGVDVVRDTLRAARETGAHALIEQSLDIADAATPEDVQVARLRSGARQWVAERWNIRELAARNGANVAVQVNVGALLLEALRQPVATLNPVLPDEPSAVKSATVQDAILLTDGESPT